MHLKKINQNCWNIGFFDCGDINAFARGERINTHWLKHPYKDRWFADPFILNVTPEEITVLVEEYKYDVGKGRIARLVVDKQNYVLKSMDIILELNTHLSFPFIYRTEHKVFVMPESAQSGKLTLYEYDDDNCTFTPIESYEGRFSDSVLYITNGQKYILTTQHPNSNKNILCIYRISNSCLEFVQQYSFPTNTARSAGSILTMNKKLYRVAQDCNRGYGRGIIFQEIKYYEKNQSFSFDETFRIPPSSWRYNLGLHTLNTFKDIAVIDGRGYRYPIVGRFVRPVISIMKKIF